MMRYSIIYIAIIIVLCSCSRRPSYVMSQDKMVDVLYDIQLAQAMYRSGSQFDTDAKKNALIDAVLEKHKISQADLDSSLFWYSDNIQDYMNINDSVSSRLRFQSNLLMEFPTNSAGRRDLSNYLVLPFYYLNQNTPIMSFHADSLKIKKIDLPSFNLSFDVQGLNQFQQAEAAIFFTYKDTVVSEVTALNENTRYRFDKPQLADSLLKDIAGYVRICNKIEGLPANVILYNINYSDSLSKPDNMQGLNPSEDSEKPVVSSKDVEGSSLMNKR